MIAFLRGIRSIRRDPELLMELRFRPLFMRVKRESPGSILACSVRASGKSAERFEIIMAAASHVNFGDPATFERGARRTGCPLSGGLAVMTDCGLGHGGNGCTQGVIMTLPAGSLAPAGGGWNDNRKVIGTVTNR